MVIDFASISDCDLATKRAVVDRKLIRGKAIAGWNRFDGIDMVVSAWSFASRLHMEILGIRKRFNVAGAVEANQNQIPYLYH